VKIKPLAGPACHPTQQREAAHPDPKNPGAAVSSTAVEIPKVALTTITEMTIGQNMLIDNTAWLVTDKL
jgi:hypothetical protein